jgi:ATP-dependent HslUV protease ATP-binding subunit HslU
VPEGSIGKMMTKMTEKNNRIEDQSFTPREVVSELDRYIIGQDAAKRSVAIALRNRWRRRQVPLPLRDEISPKNIILMGPTGSGKTEIARRLAKLAQAPFVKVEATKYTEVGYVGRDVESMVRDLADLAIKMVKEEATAKVATRAKEAAEDRLLDLLLPSAERPRSGFAGMPFDARDTAKQPSTAASDPDHETTRERLRTMFRDGKLDDREIEVEVTGSGPSPVFQMFGQPGMEDMAHGLQEALQGALGGGKKKRRKMSVPEAMEYLIGEEGERMIDMDQVQRDAIQRAEEAGIIFIDELDKVAGGHSRQGPDISREGVQRDILPIVEGSSVSTKYGTVRTDHILFVAAGAFHMSKPSDLIPELQGRFPIRVELDQLTEADFVRILVEPENSLVRQYEALLKTEGITLDFVEDGISEIARVAAVANENQENIGARRLHTVMERLLDEISFSAPDNSGNHYTIDRALVQDRLAPVLESEDLSKYIL